MDVLRLVLIVFLIRWCCARLIGASLPLSPYHLALEVARSLLDFGQSRELKPDALEDSVSFPPSGAATISSFLGVGPGPPDGPRYAGHWLAPVSASIFNLVLKALFYYFYFSIYNIR